MIPYLPSAWRASVFGAALVMASRVKKREIKERSKFDQRDVCQV